MKKRIIVLLSCAICLVSLFAFSAGAFEWIEQGDTNRVLYWHDYVERVVADQTGSFYYTTVKFPHEYQWTLMKNNAEKTVIRQELGGPEYTVNPDWAGYGSYILEWQTAYVMSLEDLERNTYNNLRVYFTTSRYFNQYDAVNVAIQYYDMYMKPCYIDRITGGGSSPGDTRYWDEYMSFRFATAVSKGAKYMRIIVSYTFTASDNITTVRAEYFDFTLPYNWESGGYIKNDGLDGYYVSDPGYKLPFDQIYADQEAAKDEALGNAADRLREMGTYLQNAFNMISYYGAGFIVVGRLIGRFAEVTWISHIILISFAIGTVGYILGLSVELTQRSRSRKNGKGGKGK